MVWCVIFNFVPNGKFKNCGAFDQNCGAFGKIFVGRFLALFDTKKGGFRFRTIENTALFMKIVNKYCENRLRFFTPFISSKN